MAAPRPSALRRYDVSPETSTGTTVTAQIPAVPVGPHYGVLLPDGTIWYPGSKKRLPAPLLLRIVVWALAFLVLLAAAGDFVIHSHPTWVDPLRRTVPAAGGTSSFSTSNTTSSSKSASPTHSAATGLAVASPQPAGIPAYTTVYTIKGTSSYQVTVKATEVSWVQAYTLTNGIDTGSPLFSGDVQPGQTETISAKGPVDLEIAAAGATVAVQSGGKQIGTVASPPSVPWHFWLEPASTK